MKNKAIANIGIYALHILLFFSLNLWVSSSARVQAQGDTTISIFYPVNQFQITEAHFPTLKKIAEDTTLIIVALHGYADTLDKPVYNAALSLKRVQAVSDWFLKNGLSPTANVSLKSYGESHAGNNPATDRRVDIQLRKKAIKAITLQPPTQKLIEKLELSTLYFIPDRAELQAASISDVELTARVLKQYTKATFEIVGHVNNATLNPKYLKNPNFMAPIQKLSENRAYRIYELLAEYGIDSTRMRWRGAGSSEMVYPNPKSKEEMLRNMRVEIWVWE